MGKPRLLDLFCGAGGAAAGYQRAGFYVVGVDHRPQPRYCGDEFVQSDAMTFPLDGFDVIHASPPCQGYSCTRHARPEAVRHPLLVPATRSRLASAGVPYVIENVIGAPLRPPNIVLCGTMFDLEATDHDGERLFLRRHRLFESNHWLTIPRACCCLDRNRAGLRVGGVYGGGPQNRKDRSRAWKRGGYTPAKAQRNELMGIEWMTLKESAEAIPPAYTEWIGTQLLAASA